MNRKAMGIPLGLLILFLPMTACKSDVQKGRYHGPPLGDQFTQEKIRLRELLAAQA